jgi:hypothetical protein
MNVKEFRSRIKPGINLSIEDREYVVEEVIKFRFDDGNFYIKCFLSGGYIFADDSEENLFILVKEVKTPFRRPFPDKLVFEGKKYRFSYTAHAVAEEIYGEEIFKKGESERFWDYKAADKSYLSLGIDDETSKRFDLCGKIVANDEVGLVN